MSIPEVNVTPGYMVVCADERCGTEGQVRFFTDLAVAEKFRVDHTDVHRQHAERINALLGEYKTDENGAVTGPAPTLYCPTCTAAIGDEHALSCDVARCLFTGAQRAFREHLSTAEPHDCGKDVWTGYHPGEMEAAEYGVPVMVLKELGRWDADKIRWVMDDGWEKRMVERGLGPAISGA